MISHLLYQAISYLPYFMQLIITITLPALAFLPQLLRTPLLASSIPIISIGLIDILAACLFKLNLYSSERVLIIMIAVNAIALWRSYHYLKQHLHCWGKNDVYLLLLNISLIIPLIAFNGLSSFISNDALASWNYWALHFYAGETPNTLGYPPFFPLLLSFCYKLLGSTDPQGPVKAICVLFPLTLLNALAFINKQTGQRIALYLLVAAIAVVPGNGFGFYRFYADGYADSMMAAALMMSMALLLTYLIGQERDFLIPGLLCAMVASLSKQPGLYWLFIAVPGLFIAKSVKDKAINWKAFIWLGLVMIPALLWLSGLGAHFYHNAGVVGRSLNNQPISIISIVGAFWRSSKQYLLDMPSLLLLFTWAGYVSRKNSYKLILFLIYVLPSLGLWFVLGSYDLRLGLQVIGAAGLLIASENYQLPIFLAFLYNALCNKVPTITLPALSKLTCLFASLLFAIFSITDQLNSHINTPFHVYPLQAGKTNIYHHFGSGAEFIYKEIYNNSSILVWAPERLVAGIFYTHTPLVAYIGPLEEGGVYRELKSNQPDYVFASLCDRKSPDCEAILTIVSKHPGLLKEIPMTGVSYNHRLFRLNKAYFSHH